MTNDEIRDWLPERLRRFELPDLASCDCSDIQKRLWAYMFAASAERNEVLSQEIEILTAKS